jgi:SAM-dependent methyltransferase
MSDSPRDVLRRYWNERYATFSIDESSCMGAGEQVNRLLYRIKERALRKALRRVGVDSAHPFSVLDMGCGLAHFAGFYHREFPRATYTGVDISTRAIEHAKSELPRDEFHADDIVAWRHPAGARFDVVQAIEVLQLLADDEAFDEAFTTFCAHMHDSGAILVPLAFSDRPSRNTSQRFRTREHFDALMRRLGLVVTTEIRMYYWLIDGGPENRLLRAVFARTGPWSLYAADRLLMALGAKNRHPDHQLSTAHMLVIQRETAAASGPRRTASEN